MAEYGQMVLACIHMKSTLLRSAACPLLMYMTAPGALPSRDLDKHAGPRLVYIHWPRHHLDRQQQCASALTPHEGITACATI